LITNWLGSPFFYAIVLRLLVGDKTRVLFLYLDCLQLLFFTH